MFIVETGRATGTRKNAIFMAVLLVLMGSFGGLLTMHWDVRPKK